MPLRPDWRTPLQSGTLQAPALARPVHIRQWSIDVRAVRLKRGDQSYRERADDHERQVVLAAVSARPADPGFPAGCILITYRSGGRGDLVFRGDVEALGSWVEVVGAGLDSADDDFQLSLTGADAATVFLRLVRWK